MGYKRTRHPMLANTPPGTWCPEAVGVVPGYPRTDEEYARRRAILMRNTATARAAGTLTCMNVPKGYGGPDGKRELQLHRELAAATAEAALRQVPDDYWMDWRAEKVMQVTVAILADPTSPRSVRLKAANLVLTYLQPKPATRRELKEAGGADKLALRLLEQLRAGDAE